MHIKFAFCLNTHKIQSHPLNTNLVNSIKSDLQKDKKNLVTNPRDTETVVITTLKNPTKETFLFPIKKQLDAPNKHKTLQMDTHNSPLNHKLIPARKQKTSPTMDAVSTRSTPQNMKNYSPLTATSHLHLPGKP